MEAVLIGVLYIQQRTDIITARLQGSWRHSYEGDRQLIESVQEKYDCCGFQDIKDMVSPPTQGPASCAEEEKQKIVAKYTETAKQLHAVCGNMDSQTLGLCAKTKNPLSATPCEIPGIKQYLADCTKMHKQNHTAYVGMERYLADYAARWVGFLIKVMVLLHLHYKTVPLGNTTPGTPARPADEQQAPRKDDDRSVATTMVDRGTLVQDDDDAGRSSNARCQGLSSRHAFTTRGDQV
ncbi:MAG: hypothetical protein Q9199_002929 [Rusavskia elegans]